MVEFFTETTIVLPDGTTRVVGTPRFVIEEDRWLELLGQIASSNADIVRDLSTCRTPADVAAKYPA